MKTCPKCGYSMMLYRRDSHPVWRCSSCGNAIDEKYDFCRYTECKECKYKDSCEEWEGCSEE